MSFGTSENDVMLLLPRLLEKNEGVIIRGKDGSFFAHLGKSNMEGAAIWLYGYEQYPPECKYLIEKYDKYREIEVEPRLVRRGDL